MLSVQEFQTTNDQYDQENKCKSLYEEASEKSNKVVDAKGGMLFKR